MTTNYSKAWEDFTKTDDYLDCWQAMEKKGMIQPYIDNILRVAFQAGWGDKKIETHKTTDA